MMTCHHGRPLLADHGQALVDNALREDSKGGRERVRVLSTTSFTGISPFPWWGQRSVLPMSLEMTEMKHIGRYRSPRVGRWLKNRLILGSMAFCLATCGVLVVFRELRPDGLGDLSGDEALEHLGGMGKAISGDATNESGRILSGSADCTDTVDNVAEMFLYVFGVLYCFVGLAIICDEYFQASLEKISYVLKLTPDVAGATFLAAGSSAPELFTSLTDAFGDSNSTGTGTIVGSAMFNILVIVALSAVVAGSDGAKIPIDWRPVCRDVSFYSLSILLLALVFLDSEVEWWEGLIMFLAYGVYIIFMVFNTRVLEQCERCDKSKRAGGEIAAVEAYERPRRQEATQRAVPHLVEVELKSVKENPSKPEEYQSAKSGFNYEKDDGESGRSSAQKVFVHQAGNGYRPSETDISSTSTVDSKFNLVNGDMSDKNTTSYGKDQELGRNQADAGNPRDADLGGAQSRVTREKKPEDRDEGEDDDDAKVFFWPDTTLDKIMYILGLPFRILLYVTVPTERWGRLIPAWYTFAFIMSLVWIGILTHYMVEWVTVVGCFLNVSPIFMGLVVLAVGTSVPDALGSMIAARNGEANMAIANAVGSNVFDILFGLGLPWLLSTLWFNKPAPVDTGGIALNVGILFCTAILFLVILKYNRWTMTTRTGAFLFILYLMYVIEVVVVELVL